MPDIYLVCDNVAVFYTPYLFGPLVLPTDLEKPSAICNQITLIGHIELMSNRQLGGKKCLTHCPIIGSWCQTIHQVGIGEQHLLWLCQHIHSAVCGIKPTH